MRKHIPLVHKLAAALGCLLPDQEIGQLRAQQVPPETILKRFDWHHIKLWAWGGPDGWYNLHPMLRDEHKQQTKKDLAAIAKVKRIRRRWNLAPLKTEGKPLVEPGLSLHRRKIPSRPFPRKEKRK